jgi:Zn finger protein HypA/HybF involved in hydrogenase expression
MNRSEAGKKGYAKTVDQLELHRQKQHTDALVAYESNPKLCLNCGTAIPYEKRENKFYNQSCSAQYNNRGVTRHIKHSRFCSCGNPKKLQNKYCSECAEKHIYNRTVRLEDATNDRIRKRIVIEQRGYQCQVCGITDWQGKFITLELDHIDGDADHNTAENLRLICPNCHSQTATYKGANAGRQSSRQQMRRKRYADGKTY